MQLLLPLDLTASVSSMQPRREVADIIESRLRPSPYGA